jgi:hypothetical protein
MNLAELLNRKEGEDNMYGVMIGEKHSYNDFGLILSDKVIAPPTPQYNKVTIPLRDAAIDLTESLTDTIKYNERLITLTFKVVDPILEWASKISAIENYVHGKKLKLIFDDDIGYYYIGRLTVNKWTSNKTIGTIVIECDAEPFKYDITPSNIDWEWDTFDLENGVINEAGEIVVNGTTVFTLICGRKRMFPTFTVSADMTVGFEGDTYTLKEGSQKLYDIFLCEGENVLTFTGSGTVAIEYIGGSL